MSFKITAKQAKYIQDGIKIAIDLVNGVDIPGKNKEDVITRLVPSVFHKITKPIYGLYDIPKPQLAKPSTKPPAQPVKKAPQGGMIHPELGTYVENHPNLFFAMPLANGKKIIKTKKKIEDWDDVKQFMLTYGYIWISEKDKKFWAFVYQGDK